MPLDIGLLNTDKEIWHSEDDNPDRIFITAHGGVGLCFGGRCVVKSLAAWVELGWDLSNEGARKI